MMAIRRNGAAWARAAALLAATGLSLTCAPAPGQAIVRDTAYYQRWFEGAKKEAEAQFDEALWYDKQYEREGASEFGCQSLVNGAYHLEKAVKQADEMLYAADKLGNDELYQSASRYRTSLVNMLEAHRDEHEQHCPKAG